VADIYLCPTRPGNDIWLCPPGPHPKPGTRVDIWLCPIVGPALRKPPAALNESVGSQGGYLTRPEYWIAEDDEIVPLLITLLEGD
jgi:hypothetical protein